MNRPNTTIYFIRHGNVYNPGQVVYGRTVDVPLSTNGMEQMEGVGKKFLSSGITPDLIVTSDMTRAVQSGQMIGISFPQAPQVRWGGLHDADSPGVINRNIPWLMSINEELYDNPDLVGLDIEPKDRIVERMQRATEEIIQANAGKTIFIVSHGHPLAFTIWKYLHPDQELPKISDLIKNNDYLQKGEAWKVVFNPEGKAIENELLHAQPEGRPATRKETS